MKFKEILLHRIRDFDAAFRSQKKLNLLGYVLLRQIFKLLKIDEKKLQDFVKSNSLKLYNYSFLTRPKTLDFLFLSKFYEPETTKFVLEQNGKIFLDIGAHIGRFAILASKKFRKVYAFEPHPSNFSTLNQNLKYNKIRNVEAVNCAISNKNGELFLSDLDINTGAVHITKKGTRTKSYKLDTIIRNLSIKQKDIDLIKIDVEKHELEVLKGSTNLLKNGNPLLIIECFNIKRISTLLSKYGYKKQGILDFYNHLFAKK